MGFFLARFAGKGALDVSASTLAPQWFIKRRAFSIMLVGLGGVAGGVVFPLLNTYLITTFGWRTAYQILGGGLWLIYIPLVFFFLISRPEDIGLRPDNKPAPSSLAVGTPLSKADDGTEEVSFTQSQALRTSAFWIIVLSIFQASMIGTGITLHFVSIFKELGYSMTFAAQIMSIRPLVGFITMVLAGLVLDKIRHQNYVLGLACLLQGVGFVMLAFLSSGPMAFVYALITGVSSALLGISVGVLKPNLFGRRYLGGILGVLVAINVIGSAIGPVIYGAAFDLLQGYQEILLISTILPLTAAGLSLFIRKPILK